jgi:hypothetical protein
MPSKQSSGGAAAVPTTSSDIQQPNGSRQLPPSITGQSPLTSQEPVESPAPIKRSSSQPDSSPKRMVRKLANVSISEWKERCPDGSPPGSTGSGSTYAVLLSQEPVTIVTTKKDQRRVSKKSITIGDQSGQTAEVSIWGLFAARSWM